MFCDRIVEIAQQKMPPNTLTVWFPRIPNGVYLVTANNDRGPQVNEMLRCRLRGPARCRRYLHRPASGEILEDRYNSQTKMMYWLGTWSYPLHVGTIWGMPSKIFWLLTCIILVTSPVTGVWMWWERRPRGKLGLPRRVDARRPAG
jgi:uncharacterized iron-regulated membrane protein